MATNKYFNNYSSTADQRLIDSLIVESIQVTGVDMVYVSRTYDEDKILNEDASSYFDSWYEVEMYPKSFDSFGDQGDFMSKIGYQIKDSATFVVASTSFAREISSVNPKINRPLEGDLLYFPLSNTLLKIVHVEHESVFYQLGALPVYELKCELLEYSHQRFETGNPLIDNFFADSIGKADDIDTLEDLGDFNEIAKNLDMNIEADDIVDFSRIDPFTRPSGIPERNT